LAITLRVIEADFQDVPIEEMAGRVRTMIS
jgi:hypothetical protein